MNAKVTLIATNTPTERRVDNGITSETWKGSILNIPIVGERFRLYDGDIGSITTSTVQSVEKLNENTYLFKTRNSTYKMELI